jgi:hypothetical protein
MSFSAFQVLLASRRLLVGSAKLADVTLALKKMGADRSA